MTDGAIQVAGGQILVPSLLTHGIATDTLGCYAYRFANTTVTVTVAGACDAQCLGAAGIYTYKNCYRWASGCRWAFEKGDFYLWVNKCRDGGTFCAILADPPVWFGDDPGDCPCMEPAFDKDVGTPFTKVDDKLTGSFDLDGINLPASRDCTGCTATVTFS